MPLTYQLSFQKQKLTGRMTMSVSATRRHHAPNKPPALQLSHHADPPQVCQIRWPEDLFWPASASRSLRHSAAFFPAFRRSGAHGAHTRGNYHQTEIWLLESQVRRKGKYVNETFLRRKGRVHARESRRFGRNAHGTKIPVLSYGKKCGRISWIG
jgi:hypothetical protein